MRFRRGRIVDYIDNIGIILARAVEVYEGFNSKLDSYGASFLKKETLRSVRDEEVAEILRELKKKLKAGEFSIDYVLFSVKETHEELDRIRMEAVNLEVPNELIKHHRFIIETISEIVTAFEYFQEALDKGYYSHLESAGQHIDKFIQNLEIALDFIKAIKKSIGVA